MPHDEIGGAIQFESIKLKAKQMRWKVQLKAKQIYIG